LGETAEIIVKITKRSPNDDFIYDTIINITLPEGLELIEGDLNWRGMVSSEEEFSITVKAVEKGDWTIEGKARSPPTGQTYMGGIDFIYLSIGKYWSNTRITAFPKPVEPCVERYFEGELVHCATSSLNSPSVFWYYSPLFLLVIYGILLFIASIKRNKKKK